MNKKIMKRACVGVCAAISAVSLGAGLMLTTSNKVAASISKASDMFINASGITVQADKSAPAQLNLDAGKKGVLLSAAQLNSSVELAPTFEGDFEMTFRPYSATSFAGKEWKDINRSDLSIAEEVDLREVAFDFTAEDGTTFSVVIRAGELYNTITPAARVEIGNVAVGNHYNKDAKVPNETGLKNSGGYYTRIGGTTFCNVAFRGDKITDESTVKSMPVTFGYDSTTMEVYVEHYGTTNVEQQHRIVLDLDDPANGLYRIDNFEDYKVKVRFTDIRPNATANLIVYDVNGQSLAGSTFTNNIGAETLVEPTFNAVAGQNYVLPAPSAFDVTEGNLASYNGTVSVVKKNDDKTTENCNVYNASGAVTSAYSAGCYFTPNVAGMYEVTYTAKDSGGVAGKARTFTISALEKTPEVSFVKNGNYKNLVEATKIGKGMNLTLYPAKVVSELLLNGVADHAQVSLYKDDAIYQNISNTVLTENKDLTLAQAGTYKIVYSLPGLPATANEEITFKVEDTAPVYSLDYVPTVESLGATLEIPTAWVTLGETKQRATPVLYSPKGTQVQLPSDKKVTLDMVGQYKILYMNNFNNVVYNYPVYFTVNNSNEYAFTPASQYASVSMGDSGDLYPAKAEGVKLTYTAVDAWVEYSRVIDLSKNTKDEPLLKIMVLPSKIGQLDFWQYTIRLTDIHNPKKYVDVIVFKGSWGNQFSYVRAGATDQTPAGWEYGKILTAYNTGCPILYSFTGETLLGTETMNLYFDYEDLALYVDNIKRQGYAYGNQIIDLNDLDCFSENMFFEGFTTGEVKLSLSVQYLQAESASILVTEINGVSMGKTIEDNVAPKIQVDTQGYATIPNGVVDSYYPLFEAEAFDSVDGKVEITKEVYFNYQTASQMKCAVTNDRFKPTQAGTYSIVYKAKDQSGNQSEKIVNVNVEESLPAWNYEFEETLRTSYYVGETFVLPDGKASGGSGKITTRIFMLDPTNKQVSLENLKFTTAGNYTLAIMLTDFLGRTTQISRQIKVERSNAPVLRDVTVPKIMLSGSKYTLPAVEAEDYSTGTLQKPTGYIEVTANGSTTKLSGREYTPTTTGDITVTYVAKNASGTETRNSYPVTVLNVKEGSGINKANYFKKYNITSTNTTETYVEFTTSTNRAKVEFANALIANNLYLEFSVPKAMNNYESVKVTYTDTENPNIAVSVYVKRNPKTDGDGNYGTNGWFTCGGEEREIYGNFYDVTATGVKLSYNNNSFYFIDKNNGVTLDKAMTTDSGKAFNGFPSGKVNVTFTFEGVSGASALRIWKIGNQVMNNDTSDSIAPEIQLLGELPATTEINQPVTIPAAISADVLNPESSVTLTIKFGSTTIYEGAIDQAYTFTPDKFGSYRITYRASAGGKSIPVPYVVRVKDKVAPEFTINGTIPTSGKVGKAITLPGVTSSDNEATNIRLWVFVTEYSGKMYALEEGATSVTFETAGRHMITYYIEDNYGNYKYHKAYITVD